MYRNQHGFTLIEIMESRITQFAGFALIELIVTIVLVGIIGTFTSLFVYVGFRTSTQPTKIKHLAIYDLNGETQRIDLAGFSFNH